MTIGARRPMSLKRGRKRASKPTALERQRLGPKAHSPRGAGTGLTSPQPREGQSLGSEAHEPKRGGNRTREPTAQKRVETEATGPTFWAWLR